MQMTPVTSSNIAAVGYDRTSRTLEVEFHNGTRYQYDDVDEDVYQDLMGAESVGKFFNANVKDLYTTTKLN